MWLKVFRFCTLLLVALVSGLSFAHVLEQPAKMAYAGPMYVELQKTLYVQWGPPQIGGFLEPLGIVSSGLLVFLLWRQKLSYRFALLALIALLVAFPLVFFWLVAPANAGFRTASLAALPLNWSDLRDQWELGHAIRFVLHFVALASLVLTVVPASSRLKLQVAPPRL